MLFLCISPLLILTVPSRCRSATDAFHRRFKCLRVIDRLTSASFLPTPSGAGGTTRGARGVRRVRELARKEEDKEAMPSIFAEEF